MTRTIWVGCHLSLCLAIAASGCADRNSSPGSHSSTTASLHSVEVPGFFFLPPVGATPPGPFSDVFERRLSPVVRIDEIDPTTGATVSTVATLTSSTPDKVRRNPSREFYIVRWRTERTPLRSASAYRVRVIVGGRELGSADVRVARTGARSRDIAAQGGLGVRPGDILPIRFRIERKAVDMDEDGVFDWEDNCATVANAATPPASDVVRTLATPARCNPDRSDCDPQEVDCLNVPKPDQVDTDADGVGDACECLNVICQAADLCHAAGHCDDATGSCTNPVLADEDSDGDCDAIDLCPADPRKTAPGRCGCGVAEVDTDGDGTPDCLDACPAHAAKTSPGVCGCAVADVDGDHDGIADCNDPCPLRGAEAGAGSCGCGTAAGDSDGDGAADCDDGCPMDANKQAAGTCGCGVPDVDTDHDGILDCQDGCPADPAKTSASVCGCGMSDADTDLDGVADCDDPCPLDPAKQAAGACGCGAADADGDGDGTSDCHDGCPDDRAKREPGRCGCGHADTDGDGDGTPDCLDACPADRAKVAVGACGCGVADTDGDQDGVPDCHDACPADATKSQAPCGLADAGVVDAASPDGGAVDAPAADSDGTGDGRPAFVDITWMSISNVFYEIGGLGVITDGYITRIPLSNFFGGGGGLASTRVPNKPDVAAVTQVMAALGGSSKVNLLLTGHSHFDHTFDTATWSSLTGAPIVGSKTTCFQAIAQGVPAGRCTVVLGGERMSLSRDVTMRVIRWNHSGTSAGEPEQHNPIELAAVPTPDPATGGLRAGVAEDFPNGGGGRAFLFTVNGAGGPFSWFFQNSASETDLTVPIVMDGVDYGAPIANLRAAMVDAGITSVDLWIGTGGASVARLVLPVLKPRAYLPVHWDGLGRAFLSGVPNRYSDSSLASVLSTAGVRLLTPVQYMDKWRLDAAGVQPVANTAVKQALGFTQ